MREEPRLRIGQVAERAGVRVSLIRYYEDIGLLAEPERVSGQRRYDETVLRRLAVIDVAQRAGLSLEEIKDLVDHGNDPMSDRLRDLAQRRLPQIDALIDRAHRVRKWLQDASSCGCERIDDCALFDTVDLPSRRDGAFGGGAAKSGAIHRAVGSSAAPGDPRRGNRMV